MNITNVKHSHRDLATLLTASLGLMPNLIACGSASSADPDAGAPDAGTPDAGDPDATTCDGDEVVCGAACTDLQTDDEHCGDCATACEDGAACVDGECAGLPFFELTGTPDPATVFDEIAETYTFDNNLTNSIWHGGANKIVTGEFSEDGYWAVPHASAIHTLSPDLGTDIHARMVQIPATNVVVYTRGTSDDGVGLGGYDVVAVAMIDPVDGTLSAGVTAEFSDGFTGACQLTSSSATRFLCYDGTAIRSYATTPGAATLSFDTTLALSTELPATAECNPGAPCYGSTFAFDGAYYYFAVHQGSQGIRDYVVYDAAGALVDTFTPLGDGGIHGTYFDWSVGRYSTHDGYGDREGGAVYRTSEGDSDTHTFGPVSPAHTLNNL